MIGSPRCDSASSFSLALESSRLEIWANVEHCTECRHPGVGRRRRSTARATALIAGRSREGTTCCSGGSGRCDSDPGCAFRGRVAYRVSREVSSFAGSGADAVIVFRIVQPGVDCNLDRIDSVSSTRSKTGIFRRVVYGHRCNAQWCRSSVDGNRIGRILPGTDYLAHYRDCRCDSLATTPKRHFGTAPGCMTAATRGSKTAR